MSKGVHLFCEFVKKNKEILILAAILVLASFFRLWHLGSIPPGFYPDEAINANQAALEPAKIFYDENNGREGLYINLVSSSFKIFGVSIASARLTSALAGILTVLGVYLLTKELLCHFVAVSSTYSSRVALLASLFLALSFWHINFSRIAFRGILVPFLLTFSFYFLFRGFRQKRVWLFVVAGIFLGLGFHAYISFRFSVLILAPILLCWFFVFRRKGEMKKFLFSISCFLLSAFIIALPIGIYFLKNPGDFFGRSSGVSIFSQEQPIKALLVSFIKHLAMFNIWGDTNWRHNISTFPVLFWPVGILFLVGLGLSMKKVFFWLQDFVKNYKKTDLRLTIYGLLLWWWSVMLLPGILTYESVPHSLRTIGAIPPTFIFAGLGGAFLIEKLKKTIGEKIKIKQNSFGFWLIIVNLIILISALVLAQYSRYFVIWAMHRETANAFSRDLVAVGHYLNSLPDETVKCVIVNMDGVLVDFIPMPAQTPMFIEVAEFGQRRATYFVPKEKDFVRTWSMETSLVNGTRTFSQSLGEYLSTSKPGQEIVIVPLHHEEQIFLNLISLFPTGYPDKENGVWVYKID